MSQIRFPAGPLLRRAREAAGVSREEAAVATFRSVSAVEQWERGVARPSPVVLRKLSELYEVDPMALRGSA